IHFPCSTTSYLMMYAKKRKLKTFHLNGISANFCCFIIGDLSLLLPEPVTYTNHDYTYTLIDWKLYSVTHLYIPYHSIVSIAILSYAYFSFSIILFPFIPKFVHSFVVVFLIQLLAY